MFISNINSFSQKTKLKVGDKIPYFELYNQNAETFDSYENINKNALVIYFYPEDNSELCTKQFCLIRDNKEKFEKFGAIVIGINSESIVNHRRFVVKNKIPVSLLFDRNNKVQKEFGVPNQRNSNKPKRYTFIVNKKGIITNVFYNKKDIQYHINQALIALNNLNNTNNLQNEN
jgi:peroxiredoxin Q/BCP